MNSNNPIVFYLTNWAVFLQPHVTTANICILSCRAFYNSDGDLLIGKFIIQLYSITTVWQGHTIQLTTPFKECISL